MIYQKDGLKAFEANEKNNRNVPLHQGPFAKFLKTLSDLQREFPPEEVPIRTALVTARNAPSHERVIKTLRAWNVRIDEAFFLGGVSKRDVLEAFGAHIFFDEYCAPDKTRCGGQLDIDMRDPRRTGVENIVWPSASLLDDGEYQFLIHNYDDQRFSECDVKLIVGNKSFVYKVGHFRESNPVLIAIVTIKDHQVQNIDHKVAPIE